MEAPFHFLLSAPQFLAQKTPFRLLTSGRDDARPAWLAEKWQPAHHASSGSSDSDSDGEQPDAATVAERKQPALAPARQPAYAPLHAQWPHQSLLALLKRQVLCPGISPAAGSVPATDRPPRPASDAVLSPFLSNSCSLPSAQQYLQIIRQAAAGRQPDGTSVISLPEPSVIVGFQEEWLEVAPAAVKLWEKHPLEPYSHVKPVVYYALCPEELLPEAQLFFKDLSATYAACNLGTHTPGPPTATLPLHSGLLPFAAPQPVPEPPKAPLSNPLTPLQAACQRLQRSLILHPPSLRPLTASLDHPGEASIVIYLVTPSAASPANDQPLLPFIEAAAALGPCAAAPDAHPPTPQAACASHAAAPSHQAPLAPPIPSPRGCQGCGKGCQLAHCLCPSAPVPMPPAPGASLPAAAAATAAAGWPGAAAAGLKEAGAGREQRVLVGGGAPQGAGGLPGLPSAAVSEAGLQLYRSAALHSHQGHAQPPPAPPSLHTLLPRPLPLTIQVVPASALQDLTASAVRATAFRTFHQIQQEPVPPKAPTVPSPRPSPAPPRSRPSSTSTPGNDLLPTPPLPLPPTPPSQHTSATNPSSAPGSGAPHTAAASNSSRASTPGGPDAQSSLPVVTSLPTPTTQPPLPPPYQPLLVLGPEHPAAGPPSPSPTPPPPSTLHCCYLLWSPAQPPPGQPARPPPAAPPGNGWLSIAFTDSTGELLQSCLLPLPPLPSRPHPAPTRKHRPTHPRHATQPAPSQPPTTTPQPPGSCLPHSPPRTLEHWACCQVWSQCMETLAALQQPPHPTLSPQPPPAPTFTHLMITRLGSATPAEHHHWQHTTPPPPAALLHLSHITIASVGSHPLLSIDTPADTPPGAYLIHPSPCLPYPLPTPLATTSTAAQQQPPPLPTYAPTSAWPTHPHAAPAALQQGPFSSPPSGTSTATLVLLPNPTASDNLLPGALHTARALHISLIHHHHYREKPPETAAPSPHPPAPHEASTPCLPPPDPDSPPPPSSPGPQPPFSNGHAPADSPDPHPPPDPQRSPPHRHKHHRSHTRSPSYDNDAPPSKRPRSQASHPSPTKPPANSSNSLPPPPPPPPPDPARPPNRTAASTTDAIKPDHPSRGKPPRGPPPPAATDRPQQDPTQPSARHPAHSNSRNASPRPCSPAPSPPLPPCSSVAPPPPAHQYPPSHPDPLIHLATHLHRLSVLNTTLHALCAHPPCYSPTGCILTPPPLPKARGPLARPPHAHDHDAHLPLHCCVTQRLLALALAADSAAARAAEPCEPSPCAPST